MAGQWQGGRLLNLGCGHGADFLPFIGKFELYGLDFSTTMITLARRYATKYEFTPHLAVADVNRLPYRDNSFDYAIAVATYHHLKTAQRLPALAELKRVLKPGGYAFITVWNRWQVRFWFRGREVMIPWRLKDQTLYRYYNLFSYAQIKLLVRNVGFQVVKATTDQNYHGPWKYLSRNICLIVKKLDRTLPNQ